VQFTLNPDVSCTDVNTAFPSTLTTTMSGARTFTSPRFSTKSAAAKCLRNSAFAGSQVSISVTGLTATGYLVDPTKPVQVSSSAGL
jgi:hypothetical protein